MAHKTGLNSYKSEKVEQQPLKKDFFNSIYFPVLVFSLGFILRVFLIITSENENVRVFTDWAVESYITSLPSFNFSHIHIIFKTSDCTPLFTYFSCLMVTLRNLLGNLLPQTENSVQILRYFLKFLLFLPNFLADLGIGIIIYKLVKKEFSSIKLGTIAGALYLWLPPVIFATTVKTSLLPVTLFFVLAAVMLSQGKGYGRPIFAGLFMSFAILNEFSVFLAISVFFWILAKNMAKKQYVGALLGIVIFIGAFFIVSSPLHRFRFQPPEPPVKIETVHGEIKKALMEPLLEEDKSFYPLYLLAKNKERIFRFTTYNAFNLWAFGEMYEPDSNVLLKTANIQMTARLSGIILTCLALLAVFILYIFRKSKNIYDDAMFFALVFFILYFIPTRGLDFASVGVFPFLGILFFKDFRSRMIFYTLAFSAWANLYIASHFELLEKYYTSVPECIRFFAVLHLIVFISFIVYFHNSGKEENIEESGDKFKEMLLEKVPFLRSAQNWFLNPENQQLTALIAASLILRVWRIGIPDLFNFDEEYYVPIAKEYFRNVSDPIMQASHPPMSQYILSFGIGFFGYNQFGWRIMSTIFGTGTIILVYYFGKSLFDKHIPAFIAAFLMSFDFIQFVHCRLAMLDMFSVFFNVLSYYLFYNFIKKGRNHYLWLMGISLGLGAACKWTTMFTIAGIAAIVIFTWIISGIMKKKFAFLDNLASADYLKVILALLIIPVLIQFFAFQPLTGSPGATVNKIKELVSYHQNLTETDAINSPWWSWLLASRAVPYIVTDVNNPDYVDGKLGTENVPEEKKFITRAAVAGVGNPLVWWLVIPALIMSIVLILRKQYWPLAFIILAFLFQYLPWAFTKRVTYLFYMLDIMPYMYLFLGFCLYYIFENSKYGKKIVCAYLILVIISFVFYYPILSAWPLKYHFYRIFDIYGIWNVPRG